MKKYIKKIPIVLVLIISMIAVQAVRADETFTVTGEIVETYRDSSVIVIAQEGEEDITIHGFPFGNLEAQLTKILYDSDSITIKLGDCVTVEYFEREFNSGEVVNKWESLTEYCDECTESCYEGDALAHKPQQSNRPFPWPGKGKANPPGKALGLPN